MDRATFETVNGTLLATIHDAVHDGQWGVYEAICWCGMQWAIVAPEGQSHMMVCPQCQSDDFDCYPNAIGEGDGTAHN